MQERGIYFRKYFGNVCTHWLIWADGWFSHLSAGWHVIDTPFPFLFLVPPLLSHSESASVLIFLNQKDYIISIFNVFKIQSSLKNNLFICIDGCWINYIKVHLLNFISYYANYIFRVGHFCFEELIISKLQSFQ